MLHLSLQSLPKNLSAGLSAKHGDAKQRAGMMEEQMCASWLLTPFAVVAHE